MVEPINRENDPRWDVIGEYVRDIADRMGLNRYYFEISHDPPTNKPTQDDYEVAAQCDYSFQALVFTLYFGECFFTEKCPEKQRHVVVHELCHVLESQRMAAVDDLARWGEISETQWNRWFAMYNRERELHIDWVASLIAPRFPLIPWGEETEV
jgi:hypothetical protein